MRIIAGKLGGRLFQSPRGHRTHPMSDKMRGALFNILGDIEGTSVLDAFSGSGALAFEASSRGAGRIVAIERDRTAQATILENIMSLGLEDSVQFVKANANGWAKTTKEQFDAVLLDPPYDALQYDLLQTLIWRCKLGGRVIISWPGKVEAPRKLDGVQLISTKNYGDSSLYIYERIIQQP